jgi:hypothetical protein
MVLGIAAGAAYGQGQGFSIEGRLEGLSEQELYLDYSENGKKYRDKVVSKDGRFSFSGRVSEPVFANIHQQNGKGEIEIFLDNSKWIVSGTAKDFNGARVTGAVIDQQWKKYFKEDQALISDRFKGAISTDEQIRADTVLQRKRIHLLKRYVREYKDSYAGVLIPTFCTIRNSLSLQDLQEIYVTVSKDMQMSSYGRDIRTRISKRQKNPLPF